MVTECVPTVNDRLEFLCQQYDAMITTARVYRKYDLMNAANGATEMAHFYSELIMNEESNA